MIAFALAAGLPSLRFGGPRRNSRAAPQTDRGNFLLLTDLDSAPMKNGLEGLEESALPLVQSPGRYVAPGGLRAVGTFDHARLRLCVLSPDSFETATGSPLLLSLFAEFGQLARSLPAEPLLYDLAATPEADLLALMMEQEL